MAEDEEVFKKILNQLAQDPRYKLKREYGRLLIMQNAQMTDEQKKRYQNLKIVLGEDMHNLE